MTVLHASVGAALAAPVVDREVVNAVFQQDSFLRLFSSIDRAGATYDIKAITADSATGANISDEDGAVTPGYATYVTGQFAPYDVIVAYGFTGREERQMGSDFEGSYFPGLDTEEMSALEELRSIFESAFLADAAEGILGQVDDDTTAWGGVNRGTSTALKSLVVAGGSGVLTMAMLNSLVIGLSESPYGAQPQLLVSAAIQHQDYIENVLENPMNMQFGRGDAGFSELSVHGVPWIRIPGFVTSEIVALSGLTPPPGAPPESASIIFVNHDVRRGTTRVQLGPSCFANVAITNLGPTGDLTSRIATMSGMLVVRRPHKQGKIEALATSW